MNGATWQHPEDGYYLFEPMGEHLNNAAQVVQVIDDVAAESIVASFNRAAGQPGFAGMLVDRDHFRNLADKETRADGWLMRTQRRPDGIYGQIRWTASGQAAVDGGEYRFFSTEYDLNDCQELGGGNPRRVRPLRLDGLTLTNMPNNLAGQKPITNRRESAPAGAPGDPMAVGRAFLVVCNRLQREVGLGFEAAWNHARITEPALYRAMGEATRSSPGLLRPARELAVSASQANGAAARFKALVLNRQSRRGVSFERAWNSLALELPDVFARAHGRALNMQEFYIRPEDAREAARLAPMVLDDLRAAKDAPRDGGNSIPPHQLKVCFLSALRMLQESGLPLDKAFAQLREEEPVFWTRGVLSYELDREEAKEPFTNFAADDYHELPGTVSKWLKPVLDKPRQPKKAL